MPVYDYKCTAHGIFYGLATMADSDKPHHCPVCGVLSPRIICVPKAVLDMPSETRTAIALNEKNQHEPLISTADQRHHDKLHAKQCGCHKPVKRQLLFTANGDKMFPSARPWMISH
jgi:putative FmdB family regulatory protein